MRTITAAVVMLSRTGITASLLASSASDAFKELEANRRKTIEEGDYKQAAHLQKQIERLKNNEDKRFRLELEAKQKLQLYELLNKQTEEKAAFDNKWMGTFDGLKQDEKEAANSMKKKHEEETIKLSESSPGGMSSLSPKWSSKLLDLRKSEESLLRMHNFVKALKVKEAADQLEAKEMKAINEKNRSLGKSEAAQLAHQQKLEMDVLKSRHKTARDEATVTLKKDIEVLQKKFKVEKQEMEKIQSLDKTDLEEAIKGWYNLDRGLAMAPSLLVPTLVESLELMNPQSFIIHRRESGIADDREKKSRPVSPKKNEGEVEKEEATGGPQDGQGSGEKKEEAAEVSSTPNAAPAKGEEAKAVAAEGKASEKSAVPKALQPKKSSGGGAKTPSPYQKTSRAESPLKKKPTAGSAAVISPLSPPDEPQPEVVIVESTEPPGSAEVEVEGLASTAVAAS